MISLGNYVSCKLGMVSLYIYLLTNMYSIEHKAKKNKKERKKKRNKRICKTQTLL